jgi:hypothetical protein
MTQRLSSCHSACRKFHDIFESTRNDVASIAFMLAWKSARLVSILQKRLSAWEQCMGNAPHVEHRRA